MSQLLNRTNEKFANFADIINEGMGKWPVSAISALLIIGWTVFCAISAGTSWWYSPFYNFPLNLVTTCAELFIGFLLAGASNRIDRNNHLLQEQQLTIMEHIDIINTEEKAQLISSKAKLLEQDQQIALILHHMDQQDAILLHITALLEKRR